MELGLDKCSKATLEERKEGQAENIQLNYNHVIQDLEQSETYKYLGIEEGEGLQHHHMKSTIHKEYKRRVKLVLKSELNPLCATANFSQFHHFAHILKMGNGFSSLCEHQ